MSVYQAFLRIFAIRESRISLLPVVLKIILGLTKYLQGHQSHLGNFSLFGLKKRGRVKYKMVIFFLFCDCDFTKPVSDELSSSNGPIIQKQTM
jgi:hypothetical protein